MQAEMNKKKKKKELERYKLHILCLCNYMTKKKANIHVIRLIEVKNIISLKISEATDCSHLKSVKVKNCKSSSKR